MKLVTTQYDVDTRAKNETLYTVANGRIGLRGITEERSGIVHPGTYINGFYDTEPIQYGENAYGYAANHETILNLPNPAVIELTVDGQEFGLDAKGTVTAHRMEMDTQTGMVTRETSWHCNHTSAVTVRSTRFATYTMPDCLCIKYEVTNDSAADETIVITSAIDTTVGNVLAEEDPRIGAKFRHKPLHIDSVQSEGATLSFEAHAAYTKLPLVGIAYHTATLGESSIAWQSCALSTDIPACMMACTLSPKQTLTIVKYIAYSTTAGGAASCLQNARVSCDTIKHEGFDTLAHAQKAILDDFWQLASISIEGDEASQEALHFNLFHLFQSAGRDGSISIAAKGLTSEGYEGHYFWDTESYVCPVFTYVAPSIASALLLYRYNHLAQAKKRAEQMNVKGALFPWRTISGNETSAYYPAGTAQYHIDADIMFALDRYIQAHPHDNAISPEVYQELAIQTARMYYSLGHFNPHKSNAFCIDDVTGPDEYTAIVNNNAFTNLMVRENLRISAQLAENVVSDEEKEQWLAAADAMYIPFDAESAVYPQDDSFMDKAEWDFAHTPKENYPLLLHYHPLVIYRHRVLKQPDLVLAQFLLSGQFTRAEKIRNFLFYEPYTTGDSSLSHCIMSIMASECGDVDKAYYYFTKTARMDIDDVHGNSRDGIHTACMAGSWMSVVYGFAGFRDYHGEYSFAPALPKQWKKLSFSLTIQGCVLEVMITHEQALYRLTKISAKNQKLQLRHRNETFVLDNEHPEQTFSLKRHLGAVLFDLDGVITNTSPIHYRAWKEMTDAEGLRFDEEMNKQLLGISREASLDVILHNNKVTWSAEKKVAICMRKNERYKELLADISAKDILPGIMPLLKELQAHNVPAVVASSSKNAPAIIRALGIADYFVGFADAAHVQKAKPEPDIFIDAADKAHVWYTDCVGIEDASAGVTAIKTAGMKAVGICNDGTLSQADMVLPSTAELSYQKLSDLMNA